MSELLKHPSAAELDALADGELAGDEQLLVRRHLESCAACALHIVSATQLKAATARAARSVTPPPDAVARLTAGLRLQTRGDVRKAGERSSPRGWLPGPAWGALAAGLVVALSLIGWRTLHPENDLAAELLDQHLAALSSAATPQVISTDRHTVKPWFQGRLPFSFNLPDTLPPDTVLEGANFAYLHGKPAALLLFTIHKHKVSVFLTQATGGVPVARLPGNRSGFSMREAITRELEIVAVSDVNGSDLDTLVAALVRVQSP